MLVLKIILTVVIVLTIISLLLWDVKREGDEKSSKKHSVGFHKLIKGHSSEQSHPKTSKESAR